MPTCLLQWLATCSKITAQLFTSFAWVIYNLKCKGESCSNMSLLYKMNMISQRYCKKQCCYILNLWIQIDCSLNLDILLRPIHHSKATDKGSQTVPLSKQTSDIWCCYGANDLVTAHVFQPWEPWHRCPPGLQILAGNDIIGQCIWLWHKACYLIVILSLSYHYLIVLASMLTPWTWCPLSLG